METNVWDSGVSSVLPELLWCIGYLRSGQTDKNTDKPMYPDTVVCLLYIFHIMEPRSFTSLMQSLKSEESVRVRQNNCWWLFRCFCFWLILLLLAHTIQNLLIPLFRILLGLISEDPAFPDNWFGLQMFQYSTILKVISTTTDLLCSRLNFLSDVPRGPANASRTQQASRASASSSSPPAHPSNSVRQPVLTPRSQSPTSPSLGRHLPEQGNIPASPGGRLMPRAVGAVSE